MNGSTDQRDSRSEKPGATQSQGHGAFIPKPLFVTISLIVVAYLILLIVEVGFRVAFPWDLLKWPESPFMTDMMKLNSGLPPYTSPSDLNSFVYSPGLEYLTFALLKPFGLALDVRFCRLVSVMIGMLASLAGTLAIKQVVRSAALRVYPRIVWFVTWGLLWLVLSTNFLSDLPHPDNLQALLGMTVFALTFAAVETKKIAYAWMVMAVAGLGVFTKQTGAICFLGPAFVFAVLRPWGWLRWFMLTAFGFTVMLLSLYLLWLPQSGRFFTLDLLRHQQVEPGKIVELAGWLLLKRRGVLWCAALASILLLWRSNGVLRRYLVCWLGIGFFSAGPNAMAYIKVLGQQNNLCLFEIWLFLAAWPGVLLLPDILKHLCPAGRAVIIPWTSPMFRNGLYACTMVYVLALLPNKPVPKSEEYAYCKQVAARAQSDVQAGRTLLVSYGASTLINSGVKKPQLDQCNSVLEILNGKRPDLLGEMKMRIQQHYYDRIYLTIGGWYGEEMLHLIHANYVVETVISKPQIGNNVFGTRGAMIQECVEYLILKPAPSAFSAQAGASSSKK